MMKKINRFLNRLFIVCLLGYLLTAGIAVARYDSYSINGITYHFRGNKAAILELDRKARALLQASELKTLPGHLHVFLAANAFDFRLLGIPAGQDSFGISNGLGRVFGFAVLAPMAEPAGVIYRAGRQRRVVSVLAHELTHLLINAEYGALKGPTLKHNATWKIEGYADYIARESSYPEQEGLALFCAGKADPNPSYAYFRYRLVVGYLLDDAGLTFRGLVSQPMDFADMEQRARQAVCH